jgi:hypothetical protein
MNLTGLCFRFECPEIRLPAKAGRSWLVGTTRQGVDIAVHLLVTNVDEVCNGEVTISSDCASIGRRLFVLLCFGTHCGFDGG